MHLRHVVPVGTTYPDRESVRLADLHKHSVAGKTCSSACNTVWHEGHW